ncbi:MAG: preprotein translocase subunit SecE [Gaiellaceae bacterium]
MARPTRQQRRARRAGSADSTLAAETRASRQSSTLRAPKPEVRPATTRRRFGFIGFIGESAAELKKVEWPGRQQLVQGTVVVIIACAIVGGYLALADLAFRHLVQNVLLG